MKSNDVKNFVLLGAICLGIVPLSGCGHYTTQRTSNVLTYLNPGEMQPMEVSKDIAKTSLPNIPVPITLGIAFVPESRTITGGRDIKIEPLTEKFKMEVMRELTAQLRQYPFLAKIEEIPSTYLKIGGSFAN